jgi:hypothetical protein
VVILANPLSTSSEDGDLIQSTVDIITTTLHSYVAKASPYEFKHGLRLSIVVLVVPSLALPSVSNRMSIPEGGRTLSAFPKRHFQFCL